MKLSAISHQLSARRRGPFRASLKLRSNRTARGFSLIELMIAIMILGLGMVMAATVFPVSLDMTRGTIQLNIAENAADAAVGTLALRVPRAKSLEKTNTLTLTSAVGLPSTVGIDRDDFNLAVADQECRGEFPPSYIDYQQRDFGTPWVGAGPNGQPLASLCTEISFWESQYYPLTGGLPAFIVRAQTLNANTGMVISEQAPSIPGVTAMMPTMAPSGDLVDLRNAPRISLADRVYPPVDLYFVDGITLRDASSPILPEIRDRRYVWTAIEFRDLEDQTYKTFFVRIVVLYRGNTSARYAMQVQPTDLATARLPVDQPATADTLLPQPWLVALDNIQSNGTITCSARVARLLPVGSYFVLAQGNTGTLPGASAKVTQNNRGTYDVNDQVATLQIAPGSFPTGGPWYVWVFPPALAAPSGVRQSGNTVFETTSPTVDVVSKKVTAG